MNEVVVVVAEGLEFQNFLADADEYTDESSEGTGSLFSDEDYDAYDDESVSSSSDGSTLVNGNETSTLIPDSSFSCTMHRSHSLPSMRETELTSMQVNVMLTQLRSVHPSTASTSEQSLPAVQKLEHIQGFAMAEVEPSSELNQRSHPSELHSEILEENQFDPKLIPYHEAANYFQEVTEDRLISYGQDIIKAVKMGDIDSLRIFCFEQKRNLSCCNRFGESIIHMACRLGQLDVVRFLIKEAKVDFRVVDDFGRNPCHDAAWQAEPNMEIIQLLITEWPDLLLISDKRGFSPLQYVRKSLWPVWVELMANNRTKILPKNLFQRPRPLIAESA